MSKNIRKSELINHLSYNDHNGSIVVNTIPSASINTDKFLVSDSGTLKYRTAAQLLSDVGAQAALSGSGFIKISGTTISYDNSTYLTTSSASSTYLPLVGGTLTNALTIKASSFGGVLYLQSGTTTDNWLLYHYSPDNTLRFNYNGAGGDEFIMATNGAATFSSTIRSNDTNGLALGGIAGYRRIQYDNSITRFGFLTDGNALADIEVRKGFFTTTGASDSTTALLANASTNDSTTYAAIFGSLNAGYRMVVRADGNVGIGTNSPGFKLEVNGNIYANGDIRSQGIFRDYQGEALLQTNTSAVTLIGSSGASTSRSLAFFAGNTERMRITSGGNVGITNTEPQGRLHIGAALVNSADATNGLILKQTSTNETTGIYLERSGERKGYAIYVGGSFDSLNFQRNNAGTKSDTLTLTRDGHVGINQQNPTGLGGPSFVVAGSGYPEVIVEKTGANARKWGFTVGSDGSYLLRDYTSGTNVFTVSTTGTANFSNTLTVGGNTVWNAANDGAGSGLDADLLDGRDSSGYDTKIDGGVTFPMGSHTGWFILARSSQQTGGSGVRGGFMVEVSSTGNYLTPATDVITGFKDWGSTAVISSVVGNNGTIFQNYRVTVDSNYTYLEGYVSYYFGGDQAINITSRSYGLNGLTWSPMSGNIQASVTTSGVFSIGKVGTGLAVPYIRTSGGIQFGSGTSTLNYYEEGTFTPTASSSIFNSVTVTFGRYVRIGNQVTVNCKWEVNPGGTGKKYFVFNLPFAFNGATGVSYTGAVSNYDSGISAYSSNVGTTVRNSSGSDTQQYVEAVFTTTNSTALHFSMTYFTF